MGLDFIKKAAPSFRKMLDRRAIELRTPTLFNRDTPSITRLASADICNGTRFNSGDKLHLRILNNKLVAQRDNVVVAQFPAPPPEFLKQVQAGAGIGKGEVKTVHVLSQTAEIGFCE
jgi:predicted RNA-binding protein with EMAP domain